jgi:hypothetical protein
VLAALLTLAVATGTASAQRQAPQRSLETTPCWKVLTNDAFDGKVDGIYPAAVYGEAIKHLPTDVQSYSTIADVITRARQAALQQAGKGVKADPARCGYAVGDKSGGASSGTGGSPSDGLVPGVIDKGANSADGFPVALIVIAIVAALLVLGGGAGFIVRRRQRNQAELDAASGATSAADDDPRELGP